MAKRKRKLPDPAELAALDPDCHLGAVHALTEEGKRQRIWGGKRSMYLGIVEPWELKKKPVKPPKLDGDDELSSYLRKIHPTEEEEKFCDGLEYDEWCARQMQRQLAYLARVEERFKQSDKRDHLCAHCRPFPIYDIKLAVWYAFWKSDRDRR